LADTPFLEEARRVNKTGKEQLYQAFNVLGLRYVLGYGNFVLVHVGDAAGINLALLKRGVIVRPVASDGLPEWLRITIGLPAENARFISALTEILTA
jgi:histidinol-phosphate aminotransferase